ncbi:MAG: ATP-binding protein [Dehalococcoidia bacterium]
MAEPWDWEESHLVALVKQRATEGPDLDFKASAAIDFSTPEARAKSRFDLTKDVSSFANSAGGTLIYGIIEDRKTHTARKLDVGYDPGVVNHERIGQVINSIKPRLANVRVRRIELSTNSPGKVAYVVVVPQASTAHQASDKRYYRRFNFEAVPMEDYEIRDVMRRSSAPRIAIEVGIEGNKAGPVTFARRATTFGCPPMDVYVTNEPSADICEYAQHQLFLPASLESSAEAPVRDAGLEGTYRVPLRPSQSKLSSGTGSVALRRYQFEYTPRDLPLFSGERRRLCELRVDYPAEAGGEGSWFCVLWRCRAPRSEPSTGALLFRQELDEHWQFEPLTIEALEQSLTAKIHLGD